MRRRLTALVLPLLCAFLLGAASAQTPLYQQFVAFIATGAAASTPVLLDDGDNSFVDAAPSSNGQCIFLAYIDRDDGNRLLIKQRAGSRLIDVPLPPTSRQALDSFARDRPGFAAPGEKQADGSIVIRGGIFTLLFTGRPAGQPNAKFHLWALDIPEPACQT